MLPKRKIIRKQYVRPESAIQGQESAPASLFEKLKAVDPNVREEGLSYVASICNFDEGPKEIAILAELISILYQGSVSLVHQCLFALANVCEVSDWVTPRLFQMGFDKALMQLNSQDKTLLKPIMVLMMALNKNIPSQYRALITLVQSNLTPEYLLSHSLQLILSFLMSTDAKKIQPQLAAKILEHFTSHEKLKTRSLSLAVLLNLQETSSNPQFIKAFLLYCEEIICDINLQNEFKTNLVLNKPIITKNNNVEGEEMEEEEEQTEYSSHPNYEMFVDTVQGIELLLEEVLKILEGEEWSDQEVDQQGDQIQEEKPSIGNGSVLKQEVAKFLIANFENLTISANLSFAEGQNIVSLALRLLVSTFPHLSSLNKQSASLTALRSIETAITLTLQDDISTQIYISALFIFLKNGLPIQGRKLMLQLGNSVMKLKDNYKDCWLFWLQLVSTYFNPEKGVVTVQENRMIGHILKNLIINIPQIQLEEWRAQTIDTLFDVYSNEQFDAIFVQLSFMQLLEAVRERGNSGKKKKKFIKEVLADIGRFLDYKRKMIKF